MSRIEYEVKALLEAWGYRPQMEITKSGKIDIYFHVDNGFDSMPTRHKDAISMLAKGYLSEFYYGGDIQHVYLNVECDGLEPDDGRYRCLIYEMKNVSSKEPLLNNSAEIFVNMGDRFKRFVNWKDVSSED